MIEKWIDRIATGIGIVIVAVFGTVILGLTMLVAFIIFDIIYSNYHKTLIQTLEAPGRGIKFVLMGDNAGFGDPTWYVYQLPAGTGITKQMKTGHNRKGVLFWNYSEAGDHCDNAKLEILKGKYLVFSRGGLYHSLYDIDTGQVLVNDENPWVSCLSEMEDESSPNCTPPYPTKPIMDTWVRENLHAKIEKILNNAK